VGACVYMFGNVLRFLMHISLRVVRIMSVGNCRFPWTGGDWLRAGHSRFGGSIPGGGLEIFLFSTACIPALGPNQSPIQSVPEDFSPGVKRRGREADHWPVSSAEIKKMPGPIPAPSQCLHGVVLSEAWGKLYLCLIISACFFLLD
jgi:hypothetical protein